MCIDRGTTRAHYPSAQAYLSPSHVPSLDLTPVTPLTLPYPLAPSLLFQLHLLTSLPYTLSFPLLPPLPLSRPIYPQIAAAVSILLLAAVPALLVSAKPLLKLLPFAARQRNTGNSHRSCLL